jgi:hypothetical protein
MTTDAQSVNGIKPIRITLPELAATGVLVGLVVLFGAQAASASAALPVTDNLRKSLRFMISFSSVQILVSHAHGFCNQDFTGGIWIAILP